MFFNLPTCIVRQQFDVFVCILRWWGFTFFYILVLFFKCKVQTCANKPILLILVFDWSVTHTQVWINCSLKLGSAGESSTCYQLRYHCLCLDLKTLVSNVNDSLLLCRNTSMPCAYLSIWTKCHQHICVCLLTIHLLWC